MRIAVLATAMSSVLVGLAMADPAAATAIKAQTNIAPQELSSALRTLAAERNLQLLYTTQTVGDRQTAGAVGEFTVVEALTQLLGGTGLAFHYVDDSTITIMPVSSLPTNGIGSGATATSNTASGKAVTEEGSKGKGFWNRLRIAQADPTSSAAGASSTDSQRSSEPRSFELEEVIVTAQKRVERMMEVPQSVSVLSSEDLSKLGATQFRDFANTIPGLTFNTAGAGETQVSLRGVTSGFDISPTVGIYVDDVPYGSSAPFTKAAAHALDVGLFDIDQIEVLRGPQGTLYGASTMGGLVKYVTKRPDATRFGIDTQLGTSSTEDGDVSYNAAAALNAPLVTDKVAVRVSGFNSHDGGYIDNLARGEEDVNSADIYGGRIDLVLMPTDELSIRIGGFAQNISRDAPASADYDLNGEAVDGDLEQRHAFAEPFFQKFRLVNGTVNYDFGSATLTSISSYQEAQARFTYDITTFIGPALELFLGRSYGAIGVNNNQGVHKFTQEVRLASNGPRQLEWLAGAYYTRETGSNFQDFSLRDLDTDPFPPNDVFTFSQPSKFEETAGFADITYHFTQRLDASVGVRYAQNSQRTVQFGDGAFGQDQVPRRSDDDVLTYLANARYHFNDNATGYLRYATGYRPGGPNLIANDPNTGLPIGPTTFEADKLNSYEIGFKGETSDRRLGIDVAAYRIDWDDMQVLTTQVFSGIGNAGTATIDGIELTLSARPLRRFGATAALAYQDARLTENAPDIGGVDGERLPNVPRFTAALSADYQLSGGTWSPSVGATLRHVSDRFASFDNSTSVAQYHLPEYSMVDLRTGFVVGSVEMQIYIRNLFDERAQLIAPTGISTLAGPVQISILQPRTVGLSAAFNF